MKTYFVRYSDMSPEDKQDFDREVEAMKAVKNRYVVEYEDHFISHDGKASIVMEFVDGGNLEELLEDEENRPKNEDEIIK